MANEVPPRVRLLFACDGAWRDPADQKWVLKQPLTLVRLPPGATFPFRAEEVWVYVQLTDGVSTFDLMAEMCQVMDDGLRRHVGHSLAITKNLPAGGQLLVIDEGFRFRNLPFREAGLYEFRLTAAGHGVLEGMTFEVRVLD